MLNVYVYESVFMCVCLCLEDVAFIRIMGGKTAQLGDKTTAALFVCSSKWNKNSKINQS